MFGPVHKVNFAVTAPILGVLCTQVKGAVEQVWDTSKEAVKRRLVNRLDGRPLAWLAAETEDDYKNVQRWVSGDTQPPHDFIARFTRAVPTSAQWLLTGVGTPDITPVPEAVAALREILELAQRAVAAGPVPPEAIADVYDDGRPGNGREEA